jgi:branched-chain amino acid:cation transporter, LIVCS family
MNKKIFTVSFAIFAMFFGAGNMVIPLYLMQKWPNDWLPAFLGFCITAVFFTLLGLISSVLVKGDIKLFFSPLGKVFGLLLQIILISIEGPFGVVPRSLIVAYGGVEAMFPINHYLFYGFTCIAIYYLSINKNRIIKVIGNIFTPVMLIFIFLIVLSSYFNYGFENINFNFNNNAAFFDGLSEGYLTYDLPGALYFTAIAMGYLIAISKEEKDLLPNGLKASMVSAVLLVVVYALFIYLSLSHTELLKDTHPEKILPTIVKGSLGQIFSSIFVLLIFLACSTTAVAAITIWSDFIHHFFPKMNYRIILGLSLFTSFMMSSIGFSKLMHVLAPILNLVYPILAALAIYNIVIHYPKKNAKRNKILI